MNLYGASGHCKVVIDSIERSGKNITAIYDDNQTITKIFDYDVIPLKDKVNGAFIITIGDNKIRKKVSAELACTFTNAIHPKAIVSTYSTIGSGTVIMAGAVISCDVKIGDTHNL